MKSELPKVLFPVLGRPMIEYVLDSLRAGGVQKMIVVIGYRGELVQETLAGHNDVEFAWQREQLGTGHAVMSAKEQLKDHAGPVLIVTGDAPMMQSASVEALLAEFDRVPASCIMGTAYKDDPTGLGRIVRDEKGAFKGIVEHRDATEEQRKIKEVNMSYYVFRCPDLLQALDYIRPNNDQGEYYVTDVPGVLASQGKEIRALPVLKPIEALGINTVAEVAIVEEAMKESSR